MILKTIHINNASYNILIALNINEWKEGLKGDKLNNYDGLLMVFPNERKVNITMEDMIYPIDILWIGSDRTIIKMENRVQPLDNLGNRNRVDGAVCMYLLEIKAGEISKNNFLINDKVIF